MSTSSIKNVYKDVVYHLRKGLGDSNTPNINIGGWDEVKGTIDDETFKVPIYDYGGLEIDQFLHVVRSHACYLTSTLESFNGQPSILARFLWVDPKASSIQRKKSVKKQEGWSFKFLFIILIFAICLGIAKEKFNFPF
jgi:hypothetical protein